MNSFANLRRHVRRTPITISEKKRKVLLKAAGIAVGILGLILFRWTPTTGRGILVYVVLFAVLIATVLVLSPRRHTGYWPKKLALPNKGSRR
jgi:hypothetical protein